MEWICERCQLEFDDTKEGERPVVDSVTDAGYCQKCADLLEARALSLAEEEEVQIEE